MADGDTVIFINEGDRHFWSAARATQGLGWRWQRTEIKVYRLDVETSQALTAAIDATKKDHDPSTGKWTPQTLKRLKHIFETVGRIRRS